jgi:fatty acid desaturase
MPKMRPNSTVSTSALGDGCGDPRRHRPGTRHLVASWDRAGCEPIVAQLTFVWTGLVTTLIFFWWQRLILSICIGGAFALALFSTLHEQRC